MNEFILGLKNKQGEALSGRTRNNYVESVQVLLEYARKQRYIPRDSTILDELNEWAEEDFDIEIFSPEELKKILACAPAVLVPVLVIGAFSGLRTAEIARLDWSEVNIQGGHIEVKARKAKTRARRLAPIPANLASWLSSLSKPAEPVWSMSLPYLHQLQRESAAAVGLKWKHNALRHSFISYRVSATNNVSQVALEAGNSPDIIFQHYRELVAPAATSEWFAITAELVASLKAQQN